MDLTEEETTLELGDLLTLTSSAFGTLTGKIIYRDETLIRVLPLDASDRAQDIPMGEDGDFAEGTGITDVVLHAKRMDPHFTNVLGVSEGERLEFFTVAGEPLDKDKPAIVAKIEEDDENDAIILADGRRLDFAFIGPPKPIGVIRVRAADFDEVDTAEEGNQEAAAEDVGLPDEYDLSLLDGLLPAAMVEEIPTAERSYPEVIQREEMYIDLLKDFSEAQQKNPSLLRRLARETELLLALKHAATVTGEDGSMKPYIKSADSLQDVLTRLGSPLSSVLPVLAVKRILYTDTAGESEPTEDMMKQVEFRDWLTHELRNYRTSVAYLAGQDAGGAAQVSKLMYSYLYDVLFREGNVLFPGQAVKAGEEITVDQDVLRSVVPPEETYGYPKLGIADGVDDRNVTTVKTRQIRVLSSLKTRNMNVIAPGDPGTALNYVVMPTNIGSTWRPVKFSGSLAEDIRASERTKVLPPLENLTNRPESYVENGFQVVKGLASADGVDPGEVAVADWLTKNMEQSVHPADILANGSVGVNRVLDSIGLRSYEWTPAVAATIWKAVAAAQSNYLNAYGFFKQEVDKEPHTAYVTGPGIPADSALYTKALEVPELAEALEQLKQMVESQGEWDLAKAQHLISSAESTLIGILYKKLVDSPDLKVAQATYKAEVRRSLLSLAAINATLAQYKAEPILNTCPHVKDKDVLRQVMMRDNGKFQAVMNRFLQRYQGKRKDNWVECSVCDTHLICIHEVMMLYERTHPGRAPALHKEILLDFGGAAFNGKYICRNCGVPISEFEYDNHLEFDDEGRPLVGRAVVEEGEKSAEDELDAILNVSMKKKTAVFEDVIEQQIYDVVRVMAQSAGFTLDDSVYLSIVTFTNTYLVNTLPPKELFEQMTAKRKVRPSYEAFKATTEIAVIAALMLCEIHTQRPMPEVLFPFVGCQFKRGGYPIESDDATALGAMEYFVCVIANINRSSDPWNSTMWSTETSPDKRQNLVRDWIMKIFDSADVKIILQKARASYTEFTAERVGGASSGDRIPFTFRPSPAAAPAQEGVPLLTDRILASVATAPLGEITGVVGMRNYELAIGSVQAAHEAARDNSFVSETSTRSEAMCCYLPIQAVRKGAMSVFNTPATELELAGLRQAESVLRKRNPTEQSNGAHLWVRWLPPEAIASIPVAPDASYFKMFMRNCFRDAREGEAHEFGRRSKLYECRHCKFRVHRDPYILMSDLSEEEQYNNDSKRKGPPRTVFQEEASAALKENGIEVNSGTFENLLSAIRKRRFVDPWIEPIGDTSLEIFTNLNALVKTDMPFMMGRATEWQLVEKAMAANFERKAAPSEEARKITWAQFVTKYDSLRQGLLDVLEGRQGRTQVRQVARKSEEVLAAIERLTEEPISQGPAEINKHWVIGLERLATGFSEMVFGTGTWFGQGLGSTTRLRSKLFGGSKWFGKKISQRHSEKFEDMINKILGATHDTNKELSRPEIRGPSSVLTHRLATYLGKIIHFWTEHMVTFQVWGVTNEELQYMLRWLILSSVETLLITESPLYNTVPKDSEKVLIQRILLGWTRSTFVEGRRQFDQFGMTEEEIRLAILDAREKEKISVIKEIDDEKDPDLRAAALVQKNLKIGRWAIGTAKNLSNYNAEFWDFLQEQRDRMGVADTGVVVAPVENAIGFDFGELPEAERGFDTYAKQDEDEGGEQ
jgi:hypothetical protein